VKVNPNSSCDVIAISECSGARPGNRDAGEPEEGADARWREIARRGYVERGRSASARYLVELLAVIERSFLATGRCRRLHLIPDGGPRPLQSAAMEEKKPFRPHVPPERSVAEFTLRAAILGSVIAVVFGAANAYIGLKVGMTVSASIPAAVISMAVLRALRGGTVLENNIVQTIGSSGESLAAGVVFTIPALFILGAAPGIGRIFVLASLGGLLGILFWIPLRRYLMVKEHGVLPFPEGTACAQVLISGEQGGSRWALVLAGIGLGAVFQFLAGAVRLFKAEVEWTIEKFHKATLGLSAEAAMLGVGFIIGPRIALLMFAGGALGWFVLIPLIHYFGAGLSGPLGLASIPISKMEPTDLWKSYLRYIGAGGVAMGGLLSIGKALPTIAGSFRAVFRDVVGGKAGIGEAAADRTDRDLPLKWVFWGALATILTLWLVLGAGGKTLVSVACVVVLGFFLVTVAARICGLVGSSSSPVSGMTITGLIVTSLLMVSLGFTGVEGQVAALTIGAVLCIAICMSGDIAQDLKTGYLVGATPWKQQTANLLALLVSASVIGFTIYLLDRPPAGSDVTHALAGGTTFKAPQANLMHMVVKGIFEGNLPWTLLLAGMAIAVVVELVGVPSLPFAIGLYLPVSLSTPILAGGLLGHLLGRGKRGAERKDRVVLVASGLVAGGAIMGILVNTLGQFLPERPGQFLLPVDTHLGSTLFTVAAFALLAAGVWLLATRQSTERTPDGPEPPAGSSGE
jgi:putative OPT family oligopeptide transporter